MNCNECGKTIGAPRTICSDCNGFFNSSFSVGRLRIPTLEYTWTEEAEHDAFPTKDRARLPDMLEDERRKLENYLEETFFFLVSEEREKDKDGNIKVSKTCGGKCTVHTYPIRRNTAFPELVSAWAMYLCLEHENAFLLGHYSLGEIVKKILSISDLGELESQEITRSDVFLYSNKS